MSIIADIVGGVVGAGAGAVLKDLSEKRRDAQLEALGYDKHELERLRAERKIARQGQEAHREVRQHSLSDIVLELRNPLPPERVPDG